MIGTAINALGILAGGMAGSLRNKPLSVAQESFWKVTLGVFTVYYGLHLTWMNLNGSLLQILKQILIVIISLSLARATGWLWRLQKMSNKLGQKARKDIDAATTGKPVPSSDGFKVCAALFCAAPLGILGAVQDGLTGYFYPLIVKAIMDGLATMSFAALFGWGVILSAIPVLIFEGTITLLCANSLAPFLQAHGLADSVNATGGLLIFCVSLLIFEVRKVPVTDYLPSLIFAPLLTYFLH